MYPLRIVNSQLGDIKALEAVVHRNLGHKTSLLYTCKVEVTSRPFEML